MNSDEISNLVRQVLTMVLSSSSATAFVSHDQTVAIAAGAAALVTVASSVYSHWNMKKVPEGGTK